MMLRGDGMAPLSSLLRAGVRKRASSSGPRVPHNVRQDKGDNGEDNGDRFRFRFDKGNNRNGGNDSQGGGDETDEEGGFRNRFGGGRGNGNGNGNGNGDNRDNNDNNGRGSFGGGGGRGNGNNGNNDNNNNNGDNGRGGFGGGGFGSGEGGRGNGRFGGGDGRGRNGNNGNDNLGEAPKTSEESSPAPTPTSSQTTPPPSSVPPEQTTSPETASPTDQAVSITTDASAIVNQGVVLLQSAVTAPPTAEANPTVTAFIPLMTPSDSAGPLNPSSTVSNTEASSLSSSDPASTPLFSNPSATGQPDTSGGAGLDLDGSNTNVGDPGASSAVQPPPGRMSPTAERILIAVGSIGGFVLVCFVVWMVWRTMKSRRNGGSSGRGCLGSLHKRIPFLGRRDWENLTSTSSRSPPPSYREKPGSTRTRSVEGFFGPEKPQLQLQTNSQPMFSKPEPWQSKSVYQPPFDGSNIYLTANGLNIASVPNVATYSHQPQGSFSSTNATQFGTMTSDYQVSTLQTGTAPTVYYNPALMGQPLAGPFNTYYQPPRQTSSDVSSLSSGFGDGDIIVSDSLVTPPLPAATTSTTTALPPNSAPNNSSPQPNMYTTRFSWMSSSAPTRAQPALSRSGTICTETSEDRPARFRSLTSWVDQQTGRIQRAQQREQASASVSPVSQAGSIPDLPVGHPGIPGIRNPPPGEQDFGLMMDDGERARRVEDTMGSAGPGR